MSASKQRKMRQEKATNGFTDPKTLREAEEQAKERRSNRMYAIIGIIFVVVAAFLVVWNSGMVQRNSTALTIDGDKYTPAEVGYFYHSSYNQIANSQYASYYGLDTKSALSSQDLNDTAKMMLGVSDDMTWDQYFKNSAVDALKEVNAMTKAANADGFEFTDDMQAEIDEFITTLKGYAKNAGYSTAKYVKALYGPYMTLDALKDILHDTTLVSHYQEHYSDSLHYSDAKLEKYYSKHKNDIDVAAYEYIYFDGAASAKTDKDGNTVDATDKEIAAAKQAASDAAEKAMARYQAGESLKKIADDYECATYSKVDDGSSSSASIMADWIFDKDRTAGDYKMIDNDPSSYLVVFHSRGRQEYNTVDVRHILIKVDSSTLDTASETYDDDLAALDKEAKAKAEDLLKQWKKGDATEESFAELAKTNSEDNADQGGLYQQIYQGQMVSEFNDWIFDSARQSGDVDIVKTDYGYHIMYFVGQNEVYWKVQVENVLKNDDYASWRESVLKDVKATEAKGMKYVG